MEISLQQFSPQSNCTLINYLRGWMDGVKSLLQFFGFEKEY